MSTNRLSDKNGKLFLATGGDSVQDWRPPINSPFHVILPHLISVPNLYIGRAPFPHESHPIVIHIVKRHITRMAATLIESAVVDSNGHDYVFTHEDMLANWSICTPLTEH